MATRDAFYFGAGYISYNSGTFRLGAGGVRAQLVKDGREVNTSEFGALDRVATDKMVRITGNLWAAWENLSALFPSGILTPVIGSALFGTAADIALTINGANGDRLVVHNVKLTKLPNLFLGVNNDLFSGEFEFTGLLRKTYLPSDADAYYTWSTGETYSPPAFSKSNFKAPVITAAWGAKTGFTSFFGRQGWNIEWALSLNNDLTKIDGHGTLDYQIVDFIARARCLPVGPTVAQMNSQAYFDQALGALESGNAADLALTASGLSVTLKNAIIANPHAIQFDRQLDRIGEVTWESTAAGGAARAVVA